MPKASNVSAFTEEQVRALFARMKGAVVAAIANGPADQRLGLSHITSRIQPVTQEQLDAIPVGSVAITCACGGTNWIFTITKKTAEGAFELEQGFIRPMPEAERVHTFASLVAIIADEIVRVVRAFDLQNLENIPIAISFGFPQVNMRTENGDIDARITQSTLPKMWRVTDCNPSTAAEQQPSLAKILRDELNKRDVHTNGRIVFANDTTAVVLDEESTEGVTTLPVGFVFGTGANSAVEGVGDDGILNLESGRAQIVTGDDATRIMSERGWAQPGVVVLEHWIGGAYLPKRAAAAILAVADKLTDAEQVAKKILNSDQQTLLSDIASGESPKNFGLHIGPSEYPIIRSTTATVLQQAGQLIGVQIASVCSAAGYTGGKVVVPYEGSLYAKGHDIAATAMQTVQQLIPGADIHMTHVSGMRGVAKLALVLSQSKEAKVVRKN
jgi:hexokinase